MLRKIENLKKETTPFWLTQTMVNTGLTPNILQYLKGLKAFVKAENITWEEFVLLTKLSRDSFKNSSLYKQKIKSLTKRTEPLSPELISLALENDDIKVLFTTHLPVRFAVDVCRDSFWRLRVLFDKALNNEDKKTILGCISELTAQEKLERDNLVDYFNMTRDYPGYHAAAKALLDLYLLENPNEVWRAAKDTILSESQIKGYVKNVNSGIKVDIDDITTVYQITGSDLLLPIIIKLLKEEHIWRYYTSVIKEPIRRADGKEKILLTNLFLPIIKTLVVEHKEGMRFSGEVFSLTELLPRYNRQKKDTDIEIILSEVFDYFKNYEYGFGFEQFQKWHGYAKKPEWITLYIESITKSEYNALLSSAKISRIIKKPSLIDKAIAKILPLKDSINDDLIAFMVWLKANDNRRYEAFKETIISEGYLEKWWNAAIERSRYVTDYARILEHFV